MDFLEICADPEFHEATRFKQFGNATKTPVWKIPQVTAGVMIGLGGGPPLCETRDFVKERFVKPLMGNSLQVIGFLFFFTFYTAPQLFWGGSGVALC